MRALLLSLALVLTSCVSREIRGPAGPKVTKPQIRFTFDAEDNASGTNFRIAQVDMPYRLGVLVLGEVAESDPLFLEVLKNGEYAGGSTVSLQRSRYFSVGVLFTAQEYFEAQTQISNPYEAEHGGMPAQHAWEDTPRLGPNEDPEVLIEVRLQTVKIDDKGRLVPDKTLLRRTHKVKLTCPMCRPV